MNETEKAMNLITLEMMTDPEYAHGWHCNIAMMCYDAIMDSHEKEPGALADDTLKHEDAHKIGNEAASRFMKMCFGVETDASGPD
jgi:hypothetical protein